MPMIRSTRRACAVGAVLLLGSMLAFSAAACKMHALDQTHQVILNTAGYQVVPVKGNVGAWSFKTYFALDQEQYRVATCEFDGSLQWVVGPGLVPDPTYANVYSTNVPGVGIRIRVDNQLVPWTKIYAKTSDMKLGGSTYTIDLARTAQSVGTGPIFPLGRVLARGFLNRDGVLRPVAELRIDTLVQISNVSCEVTTPSNFTVPMGDEPSSTFKGLGSVGPARDFGIRLRCEGPDMRLVGVSLDASRDPSNLPGVLPISSGADSAKGVGIQIVRLEGTSETPVIFNQKINVGQPGSTTTLDLPLRARYIQTTAGPVTGGMAKGTATYTIQYF